MDNKLRKMQDYLNDRVHDPAIQSGVSEIVKFASQGKRLTEAQQTVDSLVKYFYSAIAGEEKEKLVAKFHEYNLSTYEDIHDDFKDEFNLK